MWTGALSALLIVMQATVTGVLGDFADEVRFPFYAAVTAADVGFLQRMDIVALAVWMVALFVKMAFYGTLYMSAAQRLFGDKHKPLLGWAGGLAVLAVGLLLAGRWPKLSRRWQLPFSCCWRPCLPSRFR